MVFNEHRFTSALFEAVKLAWLQFDIVQQQPTSSYSILQGRKVYQKAPSTSLFLFYFSPFMGFAQTAQILTGHENSRFSRLIIHLFVWLYFDEQTIVAKLYYWELIRTRTAMKTVTLLEQCLTPQVNLNPSSLLATVITYHKTQHQTAPKTTPPSKTTPNLIENGTFLLGGTIR